MKVDFTFKHVDVSDSLMEYARERLAKLEKFELKPMDVHFTISMQKHECIIDVSMIEGRRKFKAEAISDDFYRSVEMVINKLWRQLSKDKRRLKHHKSPERSAEGELSRLNEQLEPPYLSDKFRKVG
ncbi:MAG: ribosome-associated translation inhibitor RaiA [Bdellovibrionota bacterium]